MIRALFVLLLAGCATTEPPKPSIPSDTVLICRNGELWIVSREAEQAAKFGVPCPGQTGI